MLRLADIIFKGREKKRVAPPQETQETPPQAEAAAPAKTVASSEQKPQAAPTPPKPRRAPGAAKISTPLQGQALEDLIKELEMTYMEEEEAYYVGELAYLKNEDLRGINPVMAGKKIEKAVAQTLIEHYKADPKEVEPLLGKYRKKFKNFGTTLYVRSIKHNMSGPEEEQKKE